MSFDIHVSGPGHVTRSSTRFSNEQIVDHNGDFDLNSLGLTQRFSSTTSSPTSVGCSGGILAKTTSNLTDFTDIDMAMDNTHKTTGAATTATTSATFSYQPPHFGSSTVSTLPHVRSRTADLQRDMAISRSTSVLSTGNSKFTSFSQKTAGPGIHPFNRPPQPAISDPTLKPPENVAGGGEVVYQVAPGLGNAPLMPLFSNTGGQAVAAKTGKGAKGGREGGKTGSGTGRARGGPGMAGDGNFKARKGRAAWTKANAQEGQHFEGTQGRSRILKFKVPKGVKHKKAYEDMIAAHARKRKLEEFPVDDEDDDDFKVGRGTEKKLKAQAGATMRPVRSTRQKDFATANKRQKDLEIALKAIEQDVGEQENQYWGKSKKAHTKDGRAGTKPMPIPVQPEVKKAPAPRTIRAKKPTQRASNADKSPRPTQAKRGRTAKNTTGVKKTSPTRATARKVKTATTPKPKAQVTQSADDTMQDVDEVIGAPSPASSSSSLSTASSFAPQSSASSRPSPEPADGHLIDEAEKSDLLEGTAAQETIAHDAMQNAPVVDDNQLLIDSRMPAPAAPATQSSAAKFVAVQRSLQPNTSARRNQVQSSGAYRLANYNNSAVGTFLGSPQAQFMPPIANLDARLNITNTVGWVGAQMDSAMSQQFAAQNLGGHGLLFPVGPHNNAVMEGPEMEVSVNQQLVHVEPKVFAEPPVWADKRQQLCEVLSYYRAYQSGVYQNAGIIYGMLIDAESRPYDVFNEEVIITRCGGGRGGVDANGRRAQAVHQQSSPIGLGFQRAKENKLPLVVIAGSKYRNSIHKDEWLPHRYNVLAHFQVTDVWLELNDGFQTYCCRLEKINLQEYSWWANAPYNQGSYDAPRAPTYSCRRCHSGSKVIYAQGWVCLNINCLSYFKLVDSETGFEATLTNLTYSKDFRDERTPYTGTRALVPLAPPLITQEDMIIHARSGTEEVFTKGIVCPKCRCCSRRTNFRKWTCENLMGCDFEYQLPVRTLTAQQAQPILDDGEKYPIMSEAVKSGYESRPVGHFDVDKFPVAGVDGAIVGYVFHYKSKPMINALPDGPDDLLREMQEKDFCLMRRAVRQKGHSGEILTSHYASNWGAPYKFVVSQASKPFSEAPKVIVKALKKMTWAGEAGQRLMAPGGPAFKEFNELLSIGYFENTKIGYHDDGEKELGPTIATLSLGSQAEMSLRPKRRAPEGIGRAMNNQRGTRAEELKILLNHGDIVIMHGEGVQKFYEHAVTPRGTLRYALTCRTILPEKLENDAERAEAARLAELPAGHEAWNYDGNQILEEIDEAFARSRQVVTALQRTLDDLSTMVQHSTAEELQQVQGVDEIIGAYRRVMATSTATSVLIAQPQATFAEDNNYVMVFPVQPAGEDTIVEDEVVEALGDLNMAPSASESS